MSPPPDSASSPSSSTYNTQLNAILSNMTDDTSMLDSPDISHNRLCVIRKLYVEYSSSSGPFITGDVLVNYIRNSTPDFTFCTYKTAETILNEVNTAPTIIEEDETDLITDTIIADCPECFACLQKVFPDLDGTGVDKNGWSYMAIAAVSGSLKIIKYFCTLDTPNGSCIPLLTRKANVTRNSTTLMTIAKKGNVEFLRELFNFLIPRLHELKQPNTTEDSLTAEEKYNLCKFLTPELADQFEKIGIPLYNVLSTSPAGATSYHAAVTNSPEFLFYLQKKSFHSHLTTDNSNETPLHYAVRASRLDSVTWLQTQGRPEFKDYWSSKTPSHFAAYSTSEESVEILKAVLPGPISNSLSPITISYMFTALMEGLHNTMVHRITRSDPRTFDTEDFARFEKMHEERAVKKCRLILKDAMDGAVLYEVNDEDMWDESIAMRGYFDTVKKAKKEGFKALAAVMECYGLDEDQEEVGDLVESMEEL
ncbi:hypothetical protein N7456_010496 [Penicillium angulare]|uniref:Ankyrin n=1 Tax=Penicillium angulare TaxID=116970 RepID=A0A9W9K6K0_9EURO|nr:hypothetical protein N7456_010496 [Penicillium angulare]